MLGFLCGQCWWVYLLVAIAVLYVYAWIVSEKVPKLDLLGKHVVITGGSQGIGKALAILCVKRGANVTILARKQSVIQEALREISHHNVGGKCRVMGLSCDVSKRAEVESVMGKLASDQGGLAEILSGGGGSVKGNIDVLVCNAGYSRPGLLEDQPEDEYERTMSVNYLGCVYAVRAALPYMSAGGRILLVSSMAGLTGVAGFTSYCPSKFAVRGLSEALQMELRPRGIYVSCVCPPDVDTPGYAEENKTKPPECKLADAGLFTPEQVAQDVLNSIEHWKFFVLSGFDGKMMGLLSAGMTSASSPLQVVAEVFGLGIMRLVGLGYQFYFNSQLQKMYNQRKAAGLNESKKDK